MTDQTDQTETKRDRVRRLVIEPLTGRGFRFPRVMPEADQRKALDALADALTYMSDEGLRRVSEALRTKGEGSAKCFWPCLATVEGFAEVCERRPLSELPALLRWFASAAGHEALIGDRLVAEYLFWQDRKRPPVHPRDREIVARRAVEMASKAERIRDRIGRGLQPFDDDGEWLRWYEHLGKRVNGYVSADQQGDAA
ncbi:hypothetical protein [Puniceibacterium confluentis]|uniref:hypothetical protein n=1 Tax=Puniceibacterium confluentis TaxID=1958944 RepID=UPI0011B78B36|nr:hypothetical protein [Puniceibacterium confluentis]